MQQTHFIHFKSEDGFGGLLESLINDWLRSTQKEGYKIIVLQMAYTTAEKSGRTEYSCALFYERIQTSRPDVSKT